MKHRIILSFYLMRYNLTWTSTYALAIIYFLNFCPNNNIGITVPVIPVLYTTKYSIAILHFTHQLVLKQALLYYV